MARKRASPGASGPSAWDAGAGQIVAAALIMKDLDDGVEVGALLGQVPGPVSSFTGDGACDQDGVSATVAERHPEAAAVVPPRVTAMPSETAATALPLVF